jgi:hypothetical protein
LLGIKPSTWTAGSFIETFSREEKTASQNTVLSIAGKEQSKVPQHPLIEVGAARLWRLELDSYLDAPKALLKLPKHFMSAICRLINSPSKLCRLDERAAKGTFPILSLEPFDSLLDLLATFRARNFQRQIVEKHSLIQIITETSSVGKARPDLVVAQFETEPLPLI